MRELLEPIRQWTSNGEPLILARVVKTWGSSPRPAGSALVVSSRLEMAGSVSGGCVEGEVVRRAHELLGGAPGQVHQYGVSDETAWSAGLTCGGKIEILLQRIDPGEDWWQAFLVALENNVPVVVITTRNGSETSVFFPGSAEVVGQVADEKLISAAAEQYAHQTILSEQPDGYLHVFPPRQKLVLIGASHLTAELVSLASTYDFEILVIDPREIFLQKTRFITPPDHFFDEYPSEILPSLDIDQWTYAVVLSHDPKIDDNALAWLLGSEVNYIGALGSRRSHEKRLARLENEGFSPKALEVIHGPVGVPIHARTPREIALSIMAEIILHKNKPR